MEHEEIGTPFGEALRIEFLVFLRSMSFKQQQFVKCEFAVFQTEK